MNERSTETTRDFMSVDSSRSPKASTCPTSNPANIRLFGFEFPPDSPSKESEAAATMAETNITTTTTNSSNAGTTAGSSETGRKFECHYCCRNFPTSQALGGHQNAHKRERQHAKRVHLQSAMAAAAHVRHHHHGSIAEGQVYGILNYHRLGSSPTAQHAHLPGIPPYHYPSWSSSGGGGGGRFYGSLGSVSQPINGSPLPGLWRVPNATMGMVVHRDNRSMPLPLFAGDLESRPITVLSGSSSSSSSSSSASASHRDNQPGATNHSVDVKERKFEPDRRRQPLAAMINLVVDALLSTSTSLLDHLASASKPIDGFVLLHQLEQANQSRTLVSREAEEGVFSPLGCE